MLGVGEYSPQRRVQLGDNESILCRVIKFQGIYITGSQLHSST
jgi:hypothetical protein